MVRLSLRKDASGIVFLMVDICCGKPPVLFNESLLLQAMISKCVTVPELDLFRRKIVMYDIGHHICSAWSSTNQPHCHQPAISLQAMCDFFPYAIILTWIPTISILAAPLSPFQHSHWWFIHFWGKERTIVSRTSEETNLFQDFGSLEFPLEERNSGGKRNSLESEPQSDFWP